MCGRFIALFWDEVLEVIQSIQLDTPFNCCPDAPASHRSVYPKSMVPIIAPVENGLAPFDVRWGFAAPWDDGKVLFNTRIETALDRTDTIWKNAIEHHRCIIPTWGFFEPSRTETVTNPRTGKLIKRQYVFTLPGKLTLLAGIRSDEAFSVVTTSPNDAVAPIHDRMPIVLRKEDANRWLFGDFAALSNCKGIPLNMQPEDPFQDASQPSLF